MQKEIWKDVLGYENYYLVSNLGNVKSLDNIKKGKNNCKYLKKGRILIKNNNRQNYKYVVLCKNGIKKYKLIHRLVLTAFIENKDNKPFVNHIDSNPENNKLENLEWCTASENQLHSHKTNIRKINCAKIVLDFETGIFYDSAKKASIAKCINAGYLRSQLSGHDKNKTLLKYI
jgi:hypothetical protein